MKLFQSVAIIPMVCWMCVGCTVATPRISEQDIMTRIALDREAMFKDQEPVTGPITLEEAMARAIKYNLDYRLKLMEDALALNQLKLMTYDMLPRLVAAAGYNDRDSYNASSSMNVFTRQESLAPSTSQDRDHYNADLSMTWNILDFGVSYFQAKQQADRAHIMSERRRKVIHTIMQQVRQTYWLALGAQQLEGRFEPLLKEVGKALEDVARIEKEKLRPPLETLSYKKTLLEIIKQLETLRDELGQAKPRLATLMNLPLGQPFEIIAPPSMIIPEVKDPLEVMEAQALLMRPELKEGDYTERISIYETRKIIARMLPGIEMTVGGHYDSNSFLVNEKWVEGGARLTWNLMNIFSASSQYNIAKSETEIARYQRLALSAAILTQVHVSYRDFNSRKRQYDLATQLQDIDAKIYEQTSNQTKSGSQNYLNEIRSAVSSLMADYRQRQNYAALQSSYGQLLVTLGEDPLPETVASYDIKPLSEAIAAGPSPETKQPELVMQQPSPRKKAIHKRLR